MLTPFARFTGIAAPLLRNNIDTDQIIPGRELMKVQKEGFGKGLFAGLRYQVGGAENPDFVLNQEPYRKAQVLIAGENFGCGSSRETAAWALRDFGFRCLIAPSFGAIFTSNCFRTGLLPISLEPQVVQAIAAELGDHGHLIAVDLQAGVLEVVSTFAFQIPPLQREMLLRGLDAVDFTLTFETDIGDFQARDRVARPWVYLSAI